MARKQAQDGNKAPQGAPEGAGATTPATSTEKALQDALEANKRAVALIAGVQRALSSIAGELARALG